MRVAADRRRLVDRNLDAEEEANRSAEVQVGDFMAAKEEKSLEVAAAVRAERFIAFRSESDRQTRASSARR